MSRPPKAQAAVSSSATIGFEATGLRDGASSPGEAAQWSLSAARDHFRRDDDVRWQPSGAIQTAKGSPQGERGGVHQYGIPPKTARRDCVNIPPEGSQQVASEARDNNANFAWVQHFIHHLPPDGMASNVLANGSMYFNQSGEGEIRKALIKADLVDCMVALPGQLFYSTQIPVCLWFLAKNKTSAAKRGFRDRRQQTFFIDVRKLGTLVERRIYLQDAA